MKHAYWVTLLALTFVAPNFVQAQRVIKTDTTQSGGTLVVNPAGQLTISGLDNNPLLTLTGGANTSGVQGLTIGSGFGEQGRLMVNDGSTLTNSGDASLGYAFGPPDSATVTGNGSQWKNSGHLKIGKSGSATLTIENGGLVTSYQGTISESGNPGNATGKVIVTGNGSQWQNSEQLDIGDAFYGTGILSIENGGLVVSSASFIGRLGTGIATVTGSGSQWQNSGYLLIGSNGSGKLTVENGGVVTSSGGLIGSSSHYYANDTVTVTGADSRWQISEDLSISDDYNSNSTLIVQDSGVVEIGGLLRIGSPGKLSGNGGTIVGNVINHGLIAPGSSPGVLTIDGDLTTDGVVAFELAGIDSGLFDQLIVSGEVHLGGVIEIDLLDGFHPTAGNSFKLLDFGTFIDSGYTFDFTHAALGKGLSWDVSTFASDGTISVAVPEVGSLTLLGMAMATGFIGWRMRIGR